jgi:ABC-type branched-subunit amino acid transport system substrate-binding protein
VVVTPPTGQAFRYIGSVNGTDNADAPLGPDRCHYVATLNPKTGPLGAVGLPLENAAILAVKEINETGLIDGRAICLLSGDTRTDSEFALQLITDMTAQYDLRAVNGAAASSASAKVADYLTNFNMGRPVSTQVAQVSCCSTSPVLSSNKQVSRTAPSDALQGVVLAKLAREQLSPPAQKVSVIFIGDIYGQSLTEVFKEKFEELGGTVLQTIEFSTGAPAYFDVIEAAMAGNPDYVLLVAFPGDGAQILRDWRTSGLAKDVRWLATDGLRDDRFVQGAGVDTIKYLVGTVPVLAGTHFDTFERRYKALWDNETPGVFTSNQYDAVMLIGLGLARATSMASSGDLATAIREVSGSTIGATAVSIEDLGSAMDSARRGDVINYEGASGNVDVDPNGDVLSNYRVWSVGGRGRIIDSECNWECTRVGKDECEPTDQTKCTGF